MQRAEQNPNAEEKKNLMRLRDLLDVEMDSLDIYTKYPALQPTYVCTNLKLRVRN